MIKMIDICYIIHNKIHTTRETYINDITLKLKRIYPDIVIKYIWDKSGNDLSKEELNHFIIQGKNEQHFKNACSLTLHHMLCLKDFISKVVYNNAIIIEDDCFINSEELLIDTIKTASMIQFHTIYLGDGCQPDLHISKPFGLIKTPWSRCTESILYSREGAKKTLDYFNMSQQNNKTEPQLDFFFNTAYKVIDGYLNYHAHPAPMSQGTHKRGLITTVG